MYLVRLYSDSSNSFLSPRFAIHASCAHFSFLSETYFMIPNTAVPVIGHYLVLYMYIRISLWVIVHWCISIFDGRQDEDENDL